MNIEDIEAGARPEVTEAKEGILDTSATRRQLGFRPIFPTVYSAMDAGAL